MMHVGAGGLWTVVNPSEDPYDLPHARDSFRNAFTAHYLWDHHDISWQEVLDGIVLELAGKVLPVHL